MAVMPGVLLCLASAVAFGAMAVFGKLAYGEGSTVGTLLSVRFAVAAVLLWILTASTGALAGLRRLPRRDVLAALTLGAVGYGAQAGAYFAALERLDASLLSLLLYTYPVMVTVAAIALGRDRASRRTTAALTLACGEDDDRRRRGLANRPDQVLPVRAGQPEIQKDEVGPRDGLHTEAGVVRDVAYAGMITRYLVDLEHGGELQVVHQNLETTSSQALEQQGREVTVGWSEEHTYAIPEEGT